MKDQGKNSALNPRKDVSSVFPKYCTCSLTLEAVLTGYRCCKKILFFCCVCKKYVILLHFCGMILGIGVCKVFLEIFE